MIEDKKLDELPQTTVKDNINGFVINSDGNIISKFGFFVTDENDDEVKIKFSKDGFLGKIYQEKTNIILGYTGKLGLNALVEPKKSQILALSPELADDDEFIISIPNDDDLKENGITVLIRDDDVDVSLLDDETKDQFIKNLEEAREMGSELNDLEKSYVDYIKYLYELLGEEDISDIHIEKEETYE